MEPSNEKELLKGIFTEAWKNEVFKKELIVNPVKALEKILGRSLTLPTGHRIVVSDQSDPKTMYINIPVDEENLDVELSEDELDMASGGTGASNVWDIIFKGG